MTDVRPLGLIVAIGRGGVIGDASGRLGLPWHLPEDLRHFKRTTQGHALIMGRKTHEAIGRALPGRRNLVLTRQPDAQFPGCEVVRDLDDALARVTDDPMPFVIGGASVYAEALPRCTHLFITEVDRDAEGDAFFPPFDRADFEEVARREGETEGLTFLELVRRSS